jgi:hopanoid biosynthesis associated RND transporter like protein HpnN
VGFAVARPWLVLVLTLGTTLAAGAYVALNMRMNSDTSQLVHQDAPFRRSYQAFGEMFPHYEKSSLIVVSAASHRQASDAARRLAVALRERSDLIRTLYSPDEGEFFRDHALLYLEPEELDRVLARLAEAQPVLSALATDPSLRGLAEELSQGLDALADGETVGPGFDHVAARVAEIGEAQLAGEHAVLSWEEELLREEPGQVHHVIAVQGVEDFATDISSETLLAGIRATAIGLGLVPANGVRVRLTGMVPLADGELVSVRSSVRLAAALAFSFLTVIMVLGTRSLRIIFATLATVVVGIVWTAAFALLSVGEFNTFSAAFSVLLIGLGVDFAIHICLRVQEELDRGGEIQPAVLTATTCVGGTVSLCATTSAIGFLSFVPTDYKGLAELGIITGGGMFFALVASLSFTPALLACMGRPRGRSLRLAFPPAAIAWLVRHARPIAALALVAALGAAGVATRMAFDFSTLGVKDPESESMTTLRELQAEGILTDYALTLVAPNPSAARELGRKIAALPMVAEVRLPEYYLPAEQETNLALLEDAQMLLWPVFAPRDSPSPPSAAERLETLGALHQRVLAAAGEPGPAETTATLGRLAGVLEAFLTGPQPEALTAELERRLIADLDDRLAWLERALSVEAVAFGDLPLGLRERLVSDDGHVLISALPSEDVSQVRALSRFVEAMTRIAPGATGRPVVEAGIGAIVVRSFRQAIAVAALGIALVVWIALRDAVDTVFVLTPLAVTAAFTIATGVLIDMPFNMANVLVIPLVIGLGVDNGIHMVRRFREEGSLFGALGSSMPRAIVLSGLTTLGAFGALSVSAHRGMSSTGILLSLAILYLLATTLLVLPALLAWRYREA